MEEQKFVIFRLEDRRYAMSLRHINGIEQSFRLIPVPNAPEGICGIINLRGAVIPVYSLRIRFGMGQGEDSGERSLLVTGDADALLAFEVDAVEEIEEVSADAIYPMPAVASNDDTVFMRQVVRLSDDIVIAIDADKVLSEDVRMMVHQLMEENK